MNRQKKDKCCCSRKKLSERHCACGSKNAAKSHSEKDSKRCELGQEKESHCCCCKNSSGESSVKKVRLAPALFSLGASLILFYFHPRLISFPFADPAWIAVVICGIPIVKSAFKSLKEGQITSSFLISVAMFGAIFLQFLTYFKGEGDCSHTSYFFAAGEIAFLMVLGEKIEDYTVSKTRDGLKRLVKLLPKKALRKSGENLEEINAEQIEVGDVIAVRQNEIISVDGVILSGSCLVDQSSLTGENVPVEKDAGDAVFAGTWNKSGVIFIRAEKKARDSSLAKLINLVEEAEGKKAPISRIANKWASYIVPSAIAISICVFFAAKYFLLCDDLTAIIRAITILVVFCPCAFALATPTAVAATIGALSKRGILAKSGAAIEEMTKVNSVFFDKTGTLTSAKLTVEKIFAEKDFSKEYVLTLFASAENFSEHAIARAIVEKAQSLNLKIYEPTNCVSISGIGLECTLNGDIIKISSEKNLQNISISEVAMEFISEAKNAGNTLAFLLKNGELIGAVALSAEVKSEAKSAVFALKNMGIATAILSGDNKEAVKNVAEKLGIGDVCYGLMPEEKLSIIEKSKKSGNTVMMIGDGVNDAPSLTAANVSLAMGSFGSDAAIEAADFSILNGNLQCVPQTFYLSRKMMFVIKSNMVFSICLNILAVVLGLFGIVGPVGGALLHNLSSIIVVSRSALLYLNADSKRGAECKKA